LKIDNKEILTWIEKEQSNKIGIYPFHCIKAVSNKFDISEQEALAYIIIHIKKVLDSQL